jgi:phosphate transport system protein
MSQTHTDKQYEAELSHIQEQFSAMGQLVVNMLETSMAAFYAKDANASYQVIQTDDEADRYEVQINELCLSVIARRQPLGPDLRFITTIQKSITDLERIADLCVNTAERTIELSQQIPTGVDIDVKPMADVLITMIRDVIASFISRDIKKAEEVILQDRLVDAYYAQLFRELLERMKDNAIISQASRVMAVINNLERIGDHAKNISEKTVFMTTGKDIEHKTHRKSGTRQLPRGILFLCVQNSARSQMAEGWAKKILPVDINVYSAGSAPARQVHPMAIQVMNEVGIDLSAHYPKQITDIPLGKVDTVITLCAEEICVNLPISVNRKNWLMPDPATEEDAAMRKEAFRKIRDSIQEQILKLKTELAVG